MQKGEPKRAMTSKPKNHNLSTEGKRICVTLMIIYVCAPLFIYMHPPARKTQGEGEVNI